jgi:hypothetical protein
MDISYSNDFGMLNFFAVDSSRVHSAQGRFDNFYIGGTSPDYSNDGKGPEIKLYLNTPEFKDGDEVNDKPCLWVELYDENGINTIGTGVGHDIVAIVDNSPHHTYNLNSAYEPAVGDYTRGTIMMPLNTLAPGEHTLLLRAWDMYNNSSVAKITFLVVPSLAPDFVSLVVNPAPVVAGSPAEFVLTHNRPQCEMDVTLEIFNLQGQVLWTNTERIECDGVAYTCKWNGEAQGGQPLPAGVYLVRGYMATDGSEMSTKTGKIVVVNNK